jgi:SAM-dependent methyltransferase
MTRRRTRRPTLAERADRYHLYEESVQTPDLECTFIEAVYEELRGRQALRLREDFCGTGALAAEWAGRGRQRLAYGVDLDPEPLAWGARHHLARLSAAARKRVQLQRADVRTARTPPVDVVVALNFSYWVFKDRATLRGYFAAARRALARDGLLILDAFGGPDALKMMRERTQYRRFEYVWHQDDHDPVSGDYTCHIGFRFPDGSSIPRAFSYHWRLWTLPELRELLVEAGFSRVGVQMQGYDAKGEPDDEYREVERGDPDPAWIAYLVAER